ncbi:MAG: hydrogenase 4 subunit B, partial [Nitrospirae bacterium]|nr:hydrogenase 4 subunit B [Nitrospirota bacterium]
MIFNPLELASLSVLLFLLQVFLVPFFRKNERVMANVCFSLAAAASLLAVAAGIWAVGDGTTDRAILALGLPDLPFHLRLDPLSGFFLTTIGLLSFYVSVYSIGYVKGFIGQRPVVRLIIFYSLFIAGMFMVVLADDALFFLIAWELMAAASYFLVMYEDEKAENKRAAFLYLVIAHIGAVAILLSF